MTLCPLQMEKLMLREGTWLAQDVPIAEGRAVLRPVSGFLGIPEFLRDSWGFSGFYSSLAPLHSFLLVDKY